MRIAAVVLALAACGHKDPIGAPDPGDANDLDGTTTDGAVAPDPFTTPIGTWTWVDVPGMLCGNNTPTGIGVNLSTTSNDVVVYFEGGGACWDVTTCFQTQTAIHIQDGYTASTFAGDENVFPFKRTDTSPLATPTYIWVPYCTGDLHAGMNVATYMALGQTKNVSHVGGTNAQLVVDRVKAALPFAQHVWVSGSSAGGYGATLNFHRFAAAYPTAELDLLQDSSPFVTVAANYGMWQTQWKLQFPPGCTTCTTDFTQVIAAVTTTNPASRIGLLTYDNDNTIKLFFGYGIGDTLVPATSYLLTNRYNLPETKAFVLAGTSHTMLGQLQTDVGPAPGNVKLSDWVSQWATGDSAWATQH